ncbi:hypothetical protein QQP08_012653 [Theobroma cacao]|nr:hypothetical protein QQP08_012653 [Theobroma cacao]
MGSVETASPRVIEQRVELSFAILACFQVFAAGFCCAQDWRWTQFGESLAGFYGTWVHMQFLVKDWWVSVSVRRRKERD